MKKLSEQTCQPCNDTTPRLGPENIAKLAAKVPTWEVVDGKKLFKKFKFKNYAQAQEFVNKVGAIAEQENHHPDNCFGWGYAHISISTHAIDGLSTNDFILAAKIDALNP